MKSTYCSKLFLGCEFTISPHVNINEPIILGASHA